MFKSKPSRYPAPPLSRERRDPRIMDHRSREAPPLREMREDSRGRPEMDPRRSRPFLSRPQSPYDHRGQEQREEFEEGYEEERYEEESSPLIRESRRHPVTRRDMGRDSSPFWKDVDRAKEDERPSILRFMLAMVLLVCVGIFLWLIYRWMAPSEQKEPPFIQADSAPYKIRPENPGGMNIPHQDMLVYGRLSPQQEQPPAEKLLPPPEQPVLHQPSERLPSVDVVESQVTPASAPLSSASLEVRSELKSLNLSEKKFAAVFASFPSQAQAETEAARLRRQHGFKNLVVAKTQDGKLFRVMSGTPFASQAEAEDMCVGRKGCRVTRY